MSPLNLPPFDAKIIYRNKTPHIFDTIRDKYVALTPEEWVRQHFVHYLTDHLDYPRGLISNEVCISLNNSKKRCDTVIYDRQLSPQVLIEYKAPEITITNEVFRQITRYNMALRVPLLMVSNGMAHYCCRIKYDENRVEFLDAIPRYTETLFGPV